MCPFGRKVLFLLFIYLLDACVRARVPARLLQTTKTNGRRRRSNVCTIMYVACLVVNIYNFYFFCCGSIKIFCYAVTRFDEFLINLKSQK